MIDPMVLYNIKLLDEVKSALVAKDQTLAVAESVTSGHVQAAFSLVNDATLFYQGGMTVYNVAQKYKHLAIDPIYAQKVNAVSERVASEMAANVAKLFSADIGIAITGYAAQIPELNINELFAFAAISAHNELLSIKRFISIKEDMLSAQLDFTSQLIEEMVVTLT